MYKTLSASIIDNRKHREKNEKEMVDLLEKVI